MLGLPSFHCSIDCSIDCFVGFGDNPSIKKLAVILFVFFMLVGWLTGLIF